LVASLAQQVLLATLVQQVPQVLQVRPVLHQL